MPRWYLSRVRPAGEGAEGTTTPDDLRGLK
jgi:hypothetical protein